MKICFDSNVIIDIATGGEWFLDSYSAYDVACLRRFDPFICAAATSDIVYVLHRRGLNRAEARGALPTLFELFDVFDVTSTDCKQAYESSMSDYEDALLAFSARRNGMDLIVTRNVKDFMDSPVKAISPRNFVEMFKPSDFEYESIKFPAKQGS